MTHIHYDFAERCVQNGISEYQYLFAFTNCFNVSNKIRMILFKSTWEAYFYAFYQKQISYGTVGYVFSFSVWFHEKYVVHVITIPDLIWILRYMVIDYLEKKFGCIDIKMANVKKVL